MTIDKKTRAAVFLTSLFLVLGAIAFFYVKSEVIQEAFLLLLVIPAFIFTRSDGFNIRKMLRVYSISLLYLIPLALSLLASIGDVSMQSERNYIIVANLFFAFLFASIVVATNSPVIIASIMKVAAYMMVPILLYVLYAQRGATIWGRWMPYGIHPNWWGMFALAFGWGALLFKNRVFRVAGVALAFYYMVLVQSRGAMVGLFVAVFFCSSLFVPITKKKIVFFALTLFFSPVFIWGISVLTPINLLDMLVNFFNNDVMRINDPNRGVGTGMSGRFEGYVIGWNAFLESPFWGVGFKKLGFVHNGFLLILAESGVFTFVGVIILLGRSLLKYYSSKRWLGFGFSMSYLFLLMTYPRSFNINLTGILFILILIGGFSTYPFSKENTIKGEI